MTEALEIIEAERQKFRDALEDIGKMSLHDKSGQAVVAARKALLKHGCFGDNRITPHPKGCVFDYPEGPICSQADKLSKKEDCTNWKPYAEET